MTSKVHIGLTARMVDSCVKYPDGVLSFVLALPLSNQWAKPSLRASVRACRGISIEAPWRIVTSAGRHASARAKKTNPNLVKPLTKGSKRTKGGMYK